MGNTVKSVNKQTLCVDETSHIENTLVPAKGYGNMSIENLSTAEPVLCGKGTKKKSFLQYLQPVCRGKSFLQRSQKIYSIE